MRRLGWLLTVGRTAGRPVVLRLRRTAGLPLGRLKVLPGLLLVRRTALLVVLQAGLAVSAGMASSAWSQAPELAESMQDVGTVRQWMALDARFYRTFDDNRWVDRSQFKLEQKGIYQDCLRYRHKLPALGLESFLALPEAERQRRREAALDQLTYVERYYLRVHSKVQRLRENLASGWGDWVSDPTVLGDMLQKLRTACGLDPGNHRAWHLLSYFATCAGDEERALEYLAAAGAALDTRPAGTDAEVAFRMALDRAWLLRNRGRFAEAALALEQAGELDRPLNDESTELLLLQGLVAAQTGATERAQEVAAGLERSQVRFFPANFRTTDFLPEVLDPLNWKVGTSSYLADWIRGLVLLGEGRMELARDSFGSFSMDDHYPFAWRFWNDAGYIYEATGRSGEAIRAWNTARINRPWVRNMVYKPYEIPLGVLTGRQTKAPYMLGYDSFYLAGSRLAYAASLVGAVGNAQSDQERIQRAGRALEELEICQRTGQYAGQALVLQGHVYYLLGDITSTLQRLEESLPILERQGDLEVQQAVMKDMNAITRNQQASEMESLFKQSGNSQGRWRAEADPQGRIADLQESLAASPNSWPIKRELARALIRNGQPREGRELVAADEEQAGSVAGLTLLLEADRQLGDSRRARQLVRRLGEGKAGGLADAGLWSLVGSVCLEQGRKAEAASALQHALELDPENQGVRMQLRMMGD